MWRDRRGADEQFEKQDYEEQGRVRGSGLVPSKPVSGPVGSQRFVESEVIEDHDDRDDDR